MASLGRDLDPQAADQLEYQAYVDDVVMGGSQGDVDCMRGKRLKDGYMGTVARILVYGSHDGQVHGRD